METGKWLKLGHLVELKKSPLHKCAKECGVIAVVSDDLLASHQARILALPHACARHFTGSTCAVLVQMLVSSSAQRQPSQISRALSVHTRCIPQ